MHYKPDLLPCGVYLDKFILHVLFGPLFANPKNGVEALVVCPKDVTMYQDAVKTTGYENKLKVLDLIELVHEAM